MTSSENAARRLTLAARRYAGRLLIIVLAVTLLSLATTPGILEPEDPVYETSALVVATQLTIRPEGLPRFATAVFEGGSVAEAAAATIASTYDASDLIPDRARVLPFENTVVIEVVGNDTDPALAASITNSVADAFVDELNRAGEGVGIFAIQDTARIPESPLDAPGPIVPTIIGLLAGGMLALGLLALVLTIRRPLLTSYDAAEALGRPVLARLALGSSIAGSDVPAGTAALGRALLPDDAGVCVLVSTDATSAARRQVAASLCRVQAGLGDAYLVSTAEPGTWDDLAGTSVKVVDAPPPQEVWRGSTVVVDGPTEEVLAPLLAASARFAAVVHEGERLSAVQGIVDGLPPGDAVAIIFTSARRSSRSRGLWSAR